MNGILFTVPQGLLAALLLFFCFGPLRSAHAESDQAAYQQATDAKIASLQEDVRRLKTSAQTAATGGMLSFLFGAFCALWAQNSGRSTILWFILGLCFSVLTVIILLIKDSHDKKAKNPRLFSEGRRLG